MTVYPISEEVSRDDEWIYGRRKIEESGKWYPWIKLTAAKHSERFWFLGNLSEICDRYGFEHLDEKRYDELETLFDGDRVKLVYYLYSACSPDTFKQVVNWLLGPIAKTLNEWEVTEKNVYNYIHPFDMRALLLLSEEEGFIKSKSKDMITDYMHGVSLESIREDETYWSKDDGELDSIIQAVYDREQDTIEKAEPSKIINWFIGQIMKATKGKADPALVRQKAMEMIK